MLLGVTWPPPKTPNCQRADLQQDYTIIFTYCHSKQTSLADTPCTRGYQQCAEFREL